MLILNFYNLNYNYLYKRFYYNFNLYRIKRYHSAKRVTIKSEKVLRLIRITKK